MNLYQVLILDLTNVYSTYIYSENKGKAIEKIRERYRQNGDSRALSRMTAIKIIEEKLIWEWI